jgi:hypothetical protein
MERYLAALATVATVALLAIAGALASIAATQVRQEQQKTTSCTFLNDKAKPSAKDEKLIAECATNKFWR